MTFAVESRPIIEWTIKTFNVENHPNVAAYWVFEFQNGDIEHMTGVRDNASNTYEFSTPDDFFSEARIGELTHQILLKDSTGIPVLTTKPIKDKLLREGVTLTEAGL